jgi:hypothetical protein
MISLTEITNICKETFMHLNISKTLMLILATFVMTIMGCGGGGDSSTPTPTPAGTVFNMGAYASLTTGNSYTITYTGTDTTGATYTGTQQSNIVGPTTFQGNNVIQRNVALNLTKTGVGVVLATSEQIYYNSDRTLYKMVFSNGITATPTSTFPLPLSVQIGNFAGQSLSYSNGNSITQTWQVNDAGNSTANIVINSITNLSTSEVDTLTITTAGTLTSMTQIIYNFPTAGVTTTLHGVMN